MQHGVFFRWVTGRASRSKSEPCWVSLWCHHFPTQPHFSGKLQQSHMLVMHWQPDGNVSWRKIQIHQPFPACASLQRFSVLHLRSASFSGSFICSLPLAQPSVLRNHLCTTHCSTCVLRVYASAKARVPPHAGGLSSSFDKLTRWGGLFTRPGADEVPPPCVQAQTSPQVCQIRLCCRLWSSATCWLLILAFTFHTVGSWPIVLGVFLSWKTI